MKKVCTAFRDTKAFVLNLTVFLEGDRQEFVSLKLFSWLVF